MIDKHVFFKENTPQEMRRGMFYRSMKLGKFISDCEEKGYKIHGIVFDDDNICELLFTDPSTKGGDR
jgi:hypothetical protein